MYYYEPEYYAKELAKAMEKNLANLGEAIKERLKDLDERVKKLETKK